MKNLFVLLAFLLLGYYTGISQQKSGPSLKWELEKYNYGTVYTDDMPETKLELKFTNDGNAPLVLSNVRGCCGTRIHSWPREPIMPGEEGTVSIEFRIMARPQTINRTITVTSNAEPANSVFKIEGVVAER